MPDIYSWVISQLECYPEHAGYADVVFIIHWRRQATYGAHTVDVYGSQIVTLDPSASFTPFAQITETQAKKWLEDSMGSDRIAELDFELDNKIEALKNPPTIRPTLPWLDA